MNIKYSKITYSIIFLTGIIFNIQYSNELEYSKHLLQRNYVLIEGKRIRGSECIFMFLDNWFSNQYFILFVFRYKKNYQGHSSPYSFVSICTMVYTYS